MYDQAGIDFGIGGWTFQASASWRCGITFSENSVGFLYKEKAVKLRDKSLDSWH